jgi:hypothetical protein
MDMNLINKIFYLVSLGDIQEGPIAALCGAVALRVVRGDEKGTQCLGV